MGCYNAYCMITGIPILPGQECVAMLMVDHSVILPWFAYGVADEYGQVVGRPAPDLSRVVGLDNPAMVHQAAYDHLYSQMRTALPDFGEAMALAGDKEWSANPRGRLGYGPFAYHALFAYDGILEDPAYQGLSTKMSDLFLAHGLTRMWQEVPILMGVRPPVRGSQETWDENPDKITAVTLHNLRRRIFEGNRQED